MINNIRQTVRTHRLHRAEATCPDTSCVRRTYILFLLIELEELRDYLQTNLSRGWIRESASPVGAPILFVKKKDDSLKLCVDYRGHNVVTKKDLYPLPLIIEALDSLSTAKYYTKLDIKDTYHNIKIREGNEWQTVFKTRYRLYEYTVMLFGLTNAPAIFQRWINSILNRYLDICCLVYLDNILIYSNDLAQPQKDVRNINTDYKFSHILSCIPL